MDNTKDDAINTTTKDDTIKNDTKEDDDNTIANILSAYDIESIIEFLKSPPAKLNQSTQTETE